MSLWRWSEILHALGKPTQPGPDIHGVSIDSRTLIQGEMFVALSGDPGPKFHTSTKNPRDGHAFLAAAIDRGAVAAILSQPLPLPIPTVVVDNTLTGLWQLGQAARARTGAHLLAITGSSGKTTAKGWLGELLGHAARTYTATGSLNNHWGVPLSLANMPSDRCYGVFEVGTNHPGEIAPLAALVKPDIGILLNVLPAHMSNFASLDALRQEKLAITQGFRNQGVLIAPYGLDLAGYQGQVITFGLHEKADVFATLGEHHQVQACVLGETVDYHLNSNGEHRLITSLAVLAALYASQVDLQVMAPHFSRLTVPLGRGNETLVKGVRVIDDSYNANPESMRYALEVLINSTPQGRRIALLGEMLELGGETHPSHQKIYQMMGLLDGVVTFGHGFSHYPGNWDHFNQVTDMDLGRFCQNQLRSGDHVLIKGSNRVFWAYDFVTQLIKQLEMGE